MVNKSLLTRLALIGIWQNLKIWGPLAFVQLAFIFLLLTLTQMQHLFSELFLNGRWYDFVLAACSVYIWLHINFDMYILSAIGAEKRIDLAIENKRVFYKIFFYFLYFFPGLICTIFFYINKYNKEISIFNSVLWVLLLCLIGISLAYKYGKVSVVNDKLIIDTKGRFKFLIKYIILFSCVTYFSLPVQFRIIDVSPLTVVFLGFAFISLLIGFFNYLGAKKDIPIFFILFLVIQIFSLTNDNSKIRMTSEPIDRKNIPFLNDHFKEWVMHRNVSSGDTLPMILVAAEGGGIRAMNWTAHVLQSLDNELPNFSKYIYCISGVSGGGVGATFYTAYYADKAKAKQHMQMSDSTLHKLLTSNYLSNIIGANFFTSSLQNFWPLPVPYFDNNRWLEDTWSNKYRSETGLNTFDENLSDLYLNKDGSYNYDLPSLVLNATFVETGQKAIISNLHFEINNSIFADSRHPFKDVIDVHEFIDFRDFPLKTAASLTSRFPIITNGGLISNDTYKSSGHVVDGGYYDNTGLATLGEIYFALEDEIARFETMGVKIIPFIIYLKNSKDNVSIAKNRFEPVKGIKVLQFFNIPLNAFFNTFQRNSQNTSQVYTIFFAKMKNPPKFMIFELWRQSTLPLGWYISKNAANSIKFNSDVTTFLNTESKNELSRSITTTEIKKMHRSAEANR